MANSEANRLLEERTLAFAVAVIRFAATLPNSETGRIIERQFVKAGTSIGANYREANRAESKEDFIHKIAITLKEAAESGYWTDLCQHMEFGDRHQLAWLGQESRELLAIFSTISRNARGR